MAIINKIKIRVSGVIVPMIKMVDMITSQINQIMSTMISMITSAITLNRRMTIRNRVAN